jgi:LCP family protein required for cell wall assembly
MFDHLDDPDPYVPGPTARLAAVRRGRTIRRRRRFVGSSIAMVALLAVGVVGAGAVVDHQLDDVERIDVAGLRQTTTPVDPQVVLFVGTDTDDGLEADPARVPHRRTDTLVLARVDPGNEVVTLLPLYRDLWVDIPGHSPGRISTAYELGGPDLLIDTIRQEYGIGVDRYMETDFAGAVALGDAMGGLSFAFPSEVQDQSGLHVPAGCHRYDGAELLALGRARHLKQRESAAAPWRPLDGSSDLGRTERTQVIGTALVARLTQIGIDDPVELRRLLDAFVHHVRLDQATTSAEVVDLFRAISGSTVEPVRLPVQAAVRGGADVLVVDPAAQAAVAERFSTGAPADPSTTTTLAAGVSPTPAAAIPTPC